MPQTGLLLYQEDDGAVPILKWQDSLSHKAQDKCRAKMKRLADVGHELRRPEADYLRDGIYELRVGLNHVNYRILYFFSGKDIVVISHGLTERKRVPPKEIDLAIERKELFENESHAHTHRVSDNG